MPIGLGLSLPNAASGGIYNRVLGVVEQLLLDAYPNAAAAYSTRLLNTAYTGSALRVRRSNDNAEQDIGFSGGSLDETALTAFVGANSAFVTTWYDQSGNGRNATQATAANQPRIVNAGVVDKVNGRVSVFYPGSPSPAAFTFASIAPATATSFNVIRPDANDTQTLLIHGGSDSPNYYDVCQQGSAASPADGAITISQNYVNGTMVSPLTRGQRHTRLVATPALRVDSFTGVNGGTINGISGYANFTYDNGYQSEFVFYTTNQSANRAAIEANIMSYFGITV